MNLNNIYNKLANKGLKNSGKSVKIISGLFSENDLITVLPSYFYFKIDKQGLFEICNTIIEKYDKSSNDGYTNVYDLFVLIYNEIDNFYGSDKKAYRLKFWALNGKPTDDIEEKVCSMTQIKGEGIAQCAEIVSVTNNILLILNEIGLFDYKINYMTAVLSLNNEYPEGHAFLEFDRENKKGEKLHLIYDASIPEKVIIDGEEAFYPAIYNLSDEQYKNFLLGKPFDNSNFILAEVYKVIEQRKYLGFSVEDYSKSEVSSKEL